MHKNMELGASPIFSTKEFLDETILNIRNAHEVQKKLMIHRCMSVRMEGYMEAINERIYVEIWRDASEQYEP